MKKHEDKDIKKDLPNPQHLPTGGGGEDFENLENQLKKALADYQNLEKRIAEEKSGWIKIANKGLILKLLPALDTLEKALKGARESGESAEWLKGIEITAADLIGVLKEEGLESVEVEKFNPNIHEAVGVKEGQEGEILDVLRMGYFLNGKLIRPAQVIVGKVNS